MKDLFSVCGEIRLRKGEGRTLKAGGAWVYDNEIEWTIDEATSSGDYWIPRKAILTRQ